MAGSASLAYGYTSSILNDAFTLFVNILRCSESRAVFAGLSRAAEAAPRVGGHAVLGGARRISLCRVGFGRAVTCDSHVPYTPLHSTSASSGEEKGRGVRSQVSYEL